MCFFDVFVGEAECNLLLLHYLDPPLKFYFCGLFHLRTFGGVLFISPSTIIFIIVLHFYHNNLCILNKGKTFKFNRIKGVNTLQHPLFPERETSYSWNSDRASVFFEPSLPHQGPLIHLCGKSS